MQKELNLQEQADKLSRQADLSLKFFLYYIIISFSSWTGFVAYAIYNYGTGIKW